MSVGVQIPAAKRKDPANRGILKLVHKIDRNSRAAAKLASAKAHAAASFAALRPAPHWERLEEVLEVLEGCLQQVLAERKGFREALEREQRRVLEAARG